MTYRSWLGMGAVIAFAIIAGVGTSQQPAPSSVAATQIDLPRDRAPEPTPPAPEPVSWPHEPGGALTPGSGSGATDPTIWAATVMFVPTYPSLVDGYGRLLNGAA